MSLIRTAPSGDCADAVVIGGGFYGCETALEMRRLGFKRVIIVEREAGLLKRASYVNQARVHNGYHYPRAYSTALKSRESFEAFVGEYEEAVMFDLEKYYAIAVGSRVSADQFETFCKQIGALCRPASHEIEQLFDRGMIERTFLVRELAFDSVKLADRLARRIVAANVELHLGQTARIVSQDTEGVDVDISGRRERARYVFNCTYAELEGAGIPLQTRFKRELTEMALIVAPPPLRNRGFTVMDGPFFSTMPFPAEGLHTLSHVRYTPHEALAAWDGTLLRPIRSNCVSMIRDASRYMPCLAHARVVRSIFEVKAVMVRNEDDDARPILVERSQGPGRVLSVLGAKIDNVYELRRFLRDQKWN